LRYTTAWIRDDRFSWVLSGIVWAMLVLMTVPKDFVSLVADPPPPTAAAAGASFNSLLWVVLFAIALVLVLWRVRLGWLLLRHLNVAFLIFCLLVLASVLWSAEPAVTVERFRRLIIIVVGCIAAMSVGWHRRRFQDLIRPAITFLLAGSLIYGLLFPTMAIHQSDQPELHNAWHGVTFQKNIFGSLATYGAMLWFHALLAKETSRGRGLLGLALSLICLFLSRSSTSLLSTVFSMFFLTLTLRSPANLRRYTPYFVGLFVFLVALYACAALGLVPALQGLLDPITAATGKNAANASGRAPIWALIKAEIGRHPYFGIGYGAYWVGPIPGAASYVFVTAIYFYAGSAHNGYLEVTNDLGYAGLACLIGYVWIYVRQSLTLWNIDRYQAALFLALLFQQGLENLSEAEWLQVTAVNFVVMTLATCALARALLDQKLQSLFAQSAEAAPGMGARSRRRY
jgi:O-antigen ligase